MATVETIRNTAKAKAVIDADAGADAAAAAVGTARRRPTAVNPSRPASRIMPARNRRRNAASGRLLHCYPVNPVMSPAAATKKSTTASQRSRRRLMMSRVSAPSRSRATKVPGNPAKATMADAGVGVVAAAAVGGAVAGANSTTSR